MIDLKQGDCLEIMKDIPDKSIDLVVTDCPYKIVQGGCSNNTVTFKAMSCVLDKRRRGCGKCSIKWETEGQLNNIENVKAGKIFDHNDIEFKEWLPDVYRVLKDDSHCYIMINARNLKDLQVEAEKVGFKYQQILIWNKGNATPNRWYMQGYEMILMLRKGKAVPIKNLGEKNIISVPNIKSGKKTHPTEKPIELMKIFIENSSNENDTILDPFMGTGSCGVASKELNRNFIGIEIDKKYYDIAYARLRNNQEENKWEDLD